MKFGVILARFQPIYNGHVALIGSADKLNVRNPIPIDFRIELEEFSLKDLVPNYVYKNRNLL